MPDTHRLAKPDGNFQAKRAPAAQVKMEICEFWIHHQNEVVKQCLLHHHNPLEPVQTGFIMKVLKTLCVITISLLEPG